MNSVSPQFPAETNYLNSQDAVQRINEGFFQNDLTKHRTNRPVRILSIDGGGMRGVIPLYILKEIEKRTQRAASELFDVMAGVSTGSLIVGALNIYDSLAEGKEKKA